MSHYYLSTFIGTGQGDDPYRPPTDQSMGLIDLRGDPTQQDGYALLTVEDPLPRRPGVYKLADDLDEPLSTRTMNTIRTRLNVTVEAGSLRASIVELLLRHATPRNDKTRWNRLHANSHGRHRILLGGEVVYDAPEIQNLTVTDDFNRADEALEASALWSVSDANFAIVSNQMVVTVTGPDRVAWWDNDTFGPNMYTQAECVNLGSLAGLVARYDGKDIGVDGNLYRFHFTEVASDWRLDKEIDGVGTVLANTGSRQPGLWRLTVDGSSLVGSNDGNTRISATDTDITVAGFAGFTAAHFQSDDVSTWDDFEAADLPAPPAVWVDDKVAYTKLVPSAPNPL